MSEPIRCLAVKQPWAWGLVTGVKDVENRTWHTNYRGPIAILASASEAVVNELKRSNELPELGSPFGAIVGMVDLVDIVQVSRKLRAHSPWASGPECWCIANARAFVTPIPCKGRLNLFTLDEPMALRVRAALKSARRPKKNAHVTRWVTAMHSYLDG